MDFFKFIETAPEEIKGYLEKCRKTPQSPTWHPEGDVLKHTKIVFSRAAKTGDINYMFAAIFHDLGKTESTKLNKKGSWSSYGHEFISARLVIKHKDWISSQGADADLVHDIVISHMKIKMMDEMRKTKQEEFKTKPNYEKIREFSSFDNMKTLTPEELSL